MAEIRPRPILVVGDDQSAGEQLVDALRHLHRVAVWVDAPETAVEMVQTVAFEMVVVEVAGAADWVACARIAAAADCAVTVATRFLAPDRRFRERAFRSGAAAYITEPCSAARLGEALRRVRSCERGIEIVAGSVYCEN